MNKINSLEKKFVLTCILMSLVVVNNNAAIIQNPKLTNVDDGFLELKPNGSLILRSTLNNSSNIWQEAIVFKTILNAIRSMPLQSKNTFKDLNQKIYGDGVEHKFPPFLERIIQRIQTYFSIYKYTDTSQPVWEDKKSTSTTTMKTMSSSAATATAAAASTISEIINETMTLGQNEIHANSGSDSNKDFNRNISTSLNVDKFIKPFKASTSTTTTKPALVYAEDEGNEFIEIKSRKYFEST